MSPTQAYVGLDLETLDLLCETVLEGDLDQLDALIADYIADASRLIAEMDTTLASSDMATLHRLAHTLKSSSATFGARVFSSMCAQLQTSAKTSSAAQLAEQVEKIKREFPLMCAALEDAARRKR